MEKLSLLLSDGLLCRLTMAPFDLCHSSVAPESDRPFLSFGCISAGGFGESDIFMLIFLWLLYSAMSAAFPCAC